MTKEAPDNKHLRWRNGVIDISIQMQDNLRVTDRVASIRDNVEYSNNVDEHGGKQKQMRRSQRNRFNTV